MMQVILRVHTVYLINVEQRQAAVIIWLLIVRCRCLLYLWYVCAGSLHRLAVDRY